MKKNVLKIMLVLAVVFYSTLQLKAQEIEVTNSEIFMRSENNYGTLKFYNHGELLLNKNASTSNKAFTINVGSSNDVAFRVIQNWGPNIFEVLGTGVVKVNNVAITSDSIAKEDIQILDSQLENLKKLKSVSYKWKNKKEKGEKKSYGLLAQDIAKVYPDMVYTGEEGEMAIYYIELIPILLQVTQEQQTIIEEQAKQLLDIEKRLAKLEKKSLK
jgi:hypothetical protein